MSIVLALFLMFAPPPPTSKSLGTTLNQIGASVENFRQDFGSIACTEYVSQTKLGKRDSVMYKKDHEYDYTIFMDIDKNDLKIEESRQHKKTDGKEKGLPLLVTEGFPTLLMIFHPYYQGSFKYKYIGETTLWN
ncbi:MAG: hypothetical protein P8Z37_18845 [Acidobacteriota bacterium]